MTREENLHWIDQEIRTWESECKSKHPIKEALHAARKALEQEPCEDAVSRKSVIAIIQNHWWNCRDIDKLVNDLPSVTPQEPNWIKCSEHLPDFDVDVLATTKEYGDVVKVTRWRTILKDCGWEWVLVDNIEGNVYNSDEIIAWMPLPQPYKTESEE